MITIKKGEATALKVSLNRAVATEGEATLVLHSPSRPELTFVKSLTDNGSGFFSLTLTSVDTLELVDDTYSYYLYQNDELLKHGFVRMQIGDSEGGGVFDYTFDFLLN